MGRVFFCTFPKAGSQWIRDMLCDRDVLSGNSMTGVAPAEPAVLPSEFVFNPLDAVPDRTIFGPIYNTIHRIIARQLREDDRVIYVCRDPRDMVISYLYSILHSHEERFSLTKLILRGALRSASKEDQMRIGIWWVASRVACEMLSWCEADSDHRFFYATYEQFLADTPGKLSEVFAFLGFHIGDKALKRLVREHSFLSRSGRQSGQENPYSHFRKGIIGDWQNHFSRGTGEVWEKAMPGLLQKSGYEADGNWWQNLAISKGAVPSPTNKTAEEVESLRRKVTVLEEEHRQYKQIAKDRLRQIEEITLETSSLHSQCEDKESLIGSLMHSMEALRRENEMLLQTAADRLQVSERLHETLQGVTNQCQEKEALIQSLTQSIEDLRRENEMLLQTAADRLQAIKHLDEAAQELRRQCGEKERALQELSGHYSSADVAKIGQRKS
jgi:hypothetical protein